MTVIAINGYRGAVPRFSDRLLKPNQAQRARNCRITSGRLDPIRGLGPVFTSDLEEEISTMYRYRHYVGGAPLDNWLIWAADVDVELSPLANDPRGVFYFTSDEFEPRVSAYAQAIAGAAYPDAWFALGVPSPTVKPAVSASGGSGTDEDRSYAYTFVTAWGEESGPSPASDIETGKPDGTWALSAMQTAPPNSGTVVAALPNTPASGFARVELDTVFGLAVHEEVEFAAVGGMTALNGRHRIVSIDTANDRIVVALVTAAAYTSGGTWTRTSPLNTAGMTKRIYRTAGTNPAFLFVAEIPVADTTYNDTIAPTLVAEPIQTAATLPPPKNLTCLKALPNGCLVGLSGNELCLSDPYMPYSWPISNRYSFSGRGVELVIAGNSVIVLTDSFPILFTGSDPEVMSPSTIETYAPCVSKRGVVNVGGGGLYPSFDGLWLVTPGGARKLTQDLYRENEWRALNPASFDAEFFDGQYYAQYSLGGTRTLIWVLDIAEPDGALEIDEQVSALHKNKYDGKLYVAQGARIFEWDANDGFRYESDWQSKVFQLGKPTTFNCAQVFADFDEIVPIDTSQQASNAALQALPMMGGGQIAGLELNVAEINGSLLVPVTPQSQRKVQFTLYEKDTPIYTTLVGSQKPFRLPTGYKAELFSIQLAASVPTYSVAVATSMQELKTVAP
jgi:hypothetical protein